MSHLIDNQGLTVPALILIAAVFVPLYVWFMFARTPKGRR